MQEKVRQLLAENARITPLMNESKVSKNEKEHELLKKEMSV